MRESCNLPLVTWNSVKITPSGAQETRQLIIDANISCPLIKTRFLICDLTSFCFNQQYSTAVQCDITFY